MHFNLSNSPPNLLFALCEVATFRVSQQEILVSRARNYVDYQDVEERTWCRDRRT